MRIIVLSVLLITLLSTTVSARTWYIKPDGTGDAPTIHAGVSLATAGDTVLVASGIYHDCTHPDGEGYVNCVIMKSGVTLRSECGHPDSVIIDAEGLGRVIYCNSVSNTASIEGLTLTRGQGGLAKGTRKGAGLYLRYSSPRVLSCKLIQNSCPTGAGIYMYRSSPAIDSCLFLENTALYDGGGMTCFGNCRPIITNCHFERNVGPDEHSDGGAIEVSTNCSVTIRDCTFSDNSAVQGGAMYFLYECSAIMSGCTFSGNSAGIGGAIMLYQECSVDITDCSFSRNTARGPGGAVYLYTYFAPCEHRFTRCEFSTNSAARSGAFYCDAPFLTLTDCVFSGNTADSAGAFRVKRHNPELLRCIFSDNSAVFAGGALRCTHGSQARLTDCAFSGNSAVRGGAIDCRDASPVIIGCTFSENSASEGGAIYSIDPPTEPSIDHCIFTGNAADHGGAVYCTDEALPTIANSTFVGNSATGLGAGVYCYSSLPVIENTIIAFSSPGAALGGNARLTCCDIYGNAEGDWIGPIAGKLGVDGNFSLDPNFCDLADGDLHLHGASPCVNAPGCGLVGALGIGCGPREDRIGEDSQHLLAQDGRETLEEGSPRLACRADGTGAFHILYFVPRQGGVSITVHDVEGRHVARLLDETLCDGEYSLTWQGTDHRGNLVAPGLYFITLHSGPHTLTNKALLIR